MRLPIFRKGAQVTRRFALGCALMLMCGAALASGAPWYRWKNAVNKTVMCAQVSPGNVWEIIEGPFMDSRCKKPGNPQ